MPFDHCLTPSGTKTSTFAGILPPLPAIASSARRARKRLDVGKFRAVRRREESGSLRGARGCSDVLRFPPFALTAGRIEQTLGRREMLRALVLLSEASNHA